MKDDPTAEEETRSMLSEHFPGLAWHTYAEVGALFAYDPRHPHTLLDCAIGTTGPDEVTEVAFGLIDPAVEAFARRVLDELRDARPFTREERAAARRAIDEEPASFRQREHNPGSR